ncbi:MAG TPA: hypothetical protein PK530_11935 [Anaerolineales bacterium]|nr:hypothetical protein [Anaerolineales bacterium]
MRLGSLRFFHSVRFSALSQRFLGEISLLCLAILTLLAPPPLCACWITADGHTVHPHFSESHAQSAHSHDYLFQMFPTTHPDIWLWVVVPVQVLIALALRGSLWRASTRHHWWEEGWLPRVLPPPPEGLFRFFVA